MAERSEQLLGNLDVAGRARRADHDGKLVAAEARNGVVLPENASQPVSDLHEQAVAVRVAEGIVDFLEAIKVEHHQRHFGAGGAALGMEHGLLEAIFEETAAREAGEFVGERLLQSAAFAACRRPSHHEEEQSGE